MLVYAMCRERQINWCRFYVYQWRASQLMTFDTFCWERMTIINGAARWRRHQEHRAALYIDETNDDGASKRSL
jgi:hypothetical protein